MLQIQHLTVTHAKDMTPLIADLSFSLREGERIALIGEEGNGKSTLLRLIAGGQYAPDYVETEGSILCNMKTGFLAQALLRSVGLFVRMNISTIQFILIQQRKLVIIITLIYSL